MLTKSNAVADTFGMPLPLMRIAESIFEGLALKDAKAFFADIPEDICADGKDLSRVHWLFLADVMRHLPPQTGDAKAAIDFVIDGMDKLSRGESWSGAAAYTAFDEVDFADPACAAAFAAVRAAYAYASRSGPAAAYVARFAADAARAAAFADANVSEVSRQRDVFLRLLRETK